MNNTRFLRPATKQNWSLGSTVKVGFLTLRVISEKIGTQGNYRADEFALESLDGTKFYRFTPHAGIARRKSREDALNGPANY